MKNYLPILLTLSAACGPSKHLEQSVQKLESENATLRAQQIEAAKKFEDLSASMMIVQDRLETLKVSMERQPLPVAHIPAPSVVKAKAKVKAHTADTSAFGFGVAGSALPPLKITNRDLRDVDHQIQGEPSGPKSSTEKSTASSEFSTENPEAIKAYNAAYQNFEMERYAEAIRELSDFIAKYPRHAYSDNAVYWIGESHYRLRDFDQAVEQFERVAREYPTGNKVPDALLRAGSCYLKLSKPLDAKRMFEKIIEGYPQSIAAQKAKTSLSEITDLGSPQRRM